MRGLLRKFTGGTGTSSTAWRTTKRVRGRKPGNSFTTSWNTNLPGVNIAVKGTSQGTTSDGLGSYRLAIPDDSAVPRYRELDANPAPKQTQGY